MIGRCVARVEFDRLACEGRIEVAEARIGLGAEGGRRLDRAVERLGQIETAFRTTILNADKSRRRARLLETFRNHERDRLVVMLDIRTAQQPRGSRKRVGWGKGVTVG